MPKVTRAAMQAKKEANFAAWMRCG
jgi:hypothetical protein